MNLTLTSRSYASKPIDLADLEDMVVSSTSQAAMQFVFDKIVNELRKQKFMSTVTLFRDGRKTAVTPQHFGDFGAKDPIGILIGDNRKVDLERMIGKEGTNLDDSHMFIIMKSLINLPVPVDKDQRWFIKNVDWTPKMFKMVDELRRIHDNYMPVQQLEAGIAGVVISPMYSEAAVRRAWCKVERKFSKLAEHYGLEYSPTEFSKISVLQLMWM